MRNSLAVLPLLAGLAISAPGLSAHAQGSHIGFSYSKDTLMTKDQLVQMVRDCQRGKEPRKDMWAKCSEILESANRFVPNHAFTNYTQLADYFSTLEEKSCFEGEMLALSYIRKDNRRIESHVRPCKSRERKGVAQFEGLLYDPQQETRIMSLWCGNFVTNPRVRTPTLTTVETTGRPDTAAAPKPHLPIPGRDTIWFQSPPATHTVVVERWSFPWKPVLWTGGIVGGAVGVYCGWIDKDHCRHHINITNINTAN